MEASSSGSSTVESESDCPHSEKKKKTCSVRTQSPPSSTYCCCSPPFSTTTKKTLIVIQIWGQITQAGSGGTSDSKKRKHSKVFEFITSLFLFFRFVSLRFIKTTTERNNQRRRLTFFFLITAHTMSFLLFCFEIKIIIKIKIRPRQRHQCAF